MLARRDAYSCWSYLIGKKPLPPSFTADPAKADKRTRSKWSRLMRYAAAYKSDSEPRDQRSRCSVLPVLGSGAVGETVWRFTNGWAWGCCVRFRPLRTCRREGAPAAAMGRQGTSVRLPHHAMPVSITEIDPQADGEPHHQSQPSGQRQAEHQQQ
jgi:hypothetical protein